MERGLLTPGLCGGQKLGAARPNPMTKARGHAMRQPKGDTGVTSEGKRRAVAHRAVDVAERRAVFDATNNTHSKDIMDCLQPQQAESQGAVNKTRGGALQQRKATPKAQPQLRSTRRFTPTIFIRTG